MGRRTDKNFQRSALAVLLLCASVSFPVAASLADDKPEKKNAEQAQPLPPISSARNVGSAIALTLGHLSQSIQNSVQWLDETRSRRKAYRILEEEVLKLIERTVNSNGSKPGYWRNRNLKAGVSRFSRHIADGTTALGGRTFRLDNFIKHAVRENSTAPERYTGRLITGFFDAHEDHPSRLEASVRDLVRLVEDPLFGVNLVKAMAGYFRATKEVSVDNINRIFSRQESEARKPRRRLGWKSYMKNNVTDLMRLAATHPEDLVKGFVYFEGTKNHPLTEIEVLGRNLREAGHDSSLEASFAFAEKELQRRKSILNQLTSDHRRRLAVVEAGFRNHGGVLRVVGAQRKTAKKVSTAEMIAEALAIFKQAKAEKQKVFWKADGKTQEAATTEKSTPAKVAKKPKTKRKKKTTLITRRRQKKEKTAPPKVGGTTSPKSSPMPGAMKEGYLDLETAIELMLNKHGPKVVIEPLAEGKVSVSSLKTSHSQRAILPKGDPDSPMDIEYGLRFVTQAAGYPVTVRRLGSKKNGRIRLSAGEVAFSIPSGGSRSQGPSSSSGVDPGKGSVLPSRGLGSKDFKATMSEGSSGVEVRGSQGVQTGMEFGRVVTMGTVETGAPLFAFPKIVGFQPMPPGDGMPLESIGFRPPLFREEVLEEREDWQETLEELRIEDRTGGRLRREFAMEIVEFLRAPEDAQDFRSMTQDRFRLAKNMHPDIYENAVEVLMRAIDGRLGENLKPEGLDRVVLVRLVTDLALVKSRKFPEIVGFWLRLSENAEEEREVRRITIKGLTEHPEAYEFIDRDFLVRLQRIEIESRSKEMMVMALSLNKKVGSWAKKNASTFQKDGAELFTEKRSAEELEREMRRSRRDLSETTREATRSARSRGRRGHSSRPKR